MIRKLLKWALRVPVYLIAVPIILFEDLLKDDLERLMAALSRWRPIARLEARVADMPRGAILALFLLPMVILFPVKLTAVWLIGTGHLVGGGLVLLLAKIAGTSYTVRLFHLGKDRLLSFGWFAAVYRWIGQVRAVMHRLFAACRLCVAVRTQVKAVRTAALIAVAALRGRLRPASARRSGLRRRLATLLRRRMAPRET